MDEDAEDVEVQVRQQEVNNQQQVVVQDNSRASHKDNRNKQGIFHIPATTVEASGIRPRIVQVNRALEDEEEDEEVAIVGDVLEAEAEDVKQATRAWLRAARLRELEPSQRLQNRRETSEAPDWPVWWTDGAYTPELSKPIWRGSMYKREDLIIASAETEATQTETSTVSVCHFCSRGSETSS